MTAQESAIFYSIGIGDGSWGAFYDVCCIYPIRTAIFGFSSHLQLIHGRVDLEGTPVPSPYLNATGVITFHKASRDPRITLWTFNRKPHRHIYQYHRDKIEKTKKWKNKSPLRLEHCTTGENRKEIHWRWLGHNDTSLMADRNPNHTWELHSRNAPFWNHQRL